MSESVKIERMSYGPDAVGRLASGKTVFVRGGIPGEIVDIDVVEEKDRYAKAVVASGLRVAFGLRESLTTSPCEKSTAELRESSALAPWAYLPYEIQLAAKQSNLREALIRVGHMDSDDVDEALCPITPSKDEWGYRNKLELAATTDERGRFALGFHDLGTDSIEIADKCLLGNRLIEGAPKALTGALRYLSNRADLGIYRIGVRGSLATKSVEVALWTPPGAFPRSFAAKMLCDAVGATSVVRVLADSGSARKVKRVEVLDGDGSWRESLMFDGAPITYNISAPSFFQVNTKQAAKLVSLAMDALDPQPGEKIIDLYSGAGTFSIPLAKRGAKVIAIELEGSAARDLRTNCQKNNVDIEVICDDAARALPKAAKPSGVHGARSTHGTHGTLGAHNAHGTHGAPDARSATCDALLVDPPRAGLDKKVITHIASVRPKRIVYVSCDPQTLARDAARLAAHGYTLKRATPVDLFPQTYHCETVAIFC